MTDSAFSKKACENVMSHISQAFSSNVIVQSQLIPNLWNHNREFTSLIPNYGRRSARRHSSLRSTPDPAGLPSPDTGEAVPLNPVKAYLWEYPWDWGRTGC